MSEKQLGNMNSIPTDHFPSDWREQGMVKFSCGRTKIEEIVYGVKPVTVKNQDIFDFYLAMAENGKQDFLAKQKQREERLKTLTQA